MTKKGGRTAAGVLCALFLAIPVACQSGPSQQSSTVPVISDTGDLRGPRQPIFFRHDIHAGQDKIPCLYCHATVEISSEPGIPALETCMGCHRLIAGSTDSHRAEIQKVRQAWSDRKPPEWVRIHALPGFVRFPHHRHIKVLGTESCAACHGNVIGMPQVYQAASLKMGWCIRCHVERQVSRDCTVCHY